MCLFVFLNVLSFPLRSIYFKPGVSATSVGMLEKVKYIITKPAYRGKRKYTITKNA